MRAKGSEKGKRGRNDKTMIKSQLTEIWKKFKKAFPVIAFFLFLFCTVILIFGSRCVMVVSIVTVVFKGNYSKRQSWGKLFGVAGIQIFLCLLAYVATWNLAFRLILNFIVPFCQIFFKADQFNKLAYFSGLMSFIFLQLMPLDFYGFLRQGAAFLYGLTCFLLITALYRRAHPLVPDYGRQQKGLKVYACWLRAMAEGKTDGHEEQILYQLSQSLYRDAYMRRGRREIVDIEGKVSYIFALIFQRAAYFIGSGQTLPLSEDQETREKELDFVCRCADYLETAGSCDFWENAMREDLFDRGHKLLQEAKDHEGEIFSIMQNCLRQFLIILDTLRQFKEGEDSSGWEMPERQRMAGRFRRHFQMDAFEFRFAMRMSLVMVITFAYVVISQADHGYWLPLNAFLLLRPMYEDSQYRMKTRFIGTVVGCGIMIFVLPFLPRPGGHFILAGIMAACMYTATPGTRVHAGFVTCFGLSMATLAMGESSAIELRLLYVIAAVAVVLVVNRFFFPTSMGQQFHYNIQQLFHMHHVYLRILGRSLSMPLDYGIICDAQLSYHMIHDQLREYIEKNKPEKSEALKEFLKISRRMVSEMEQMLFLINTRRRGLDAMKTLEDYIAFTDYVLNQAQQRLRLRPEKNIRQIRDLSYHRWIEREPELSYLMIQYGKNVSRVYRLVCENT